MSTTTLPRPSAATVATTARIAACAVQATKTYGRGDAQVTYPEDRRFPMTSSGETKKCARASCRCPVAKDREYCGTSCEGEGDSTDILCNCGHSGCRDHK